MEEKNDNDDAWLGNIFDDMQPFPLVQHPDQQQQVAVDVDIAKALRNTCVVGACFHHETNAGAMFIGTFIREAALINGSLGQRKSGHQVSDSSVNKNGFCLQCISKKRREAKKKGGCTFGARAVCQVAGDPRVLVVKSCNLQHAPDCPWLQGKMEATKGTRVKWVAAAANSSLQSLHFPNMGPRNVGHVKQAIQTVLTAGDALLTKRQAQAVVYKAKGLRLDDFFEDIAELAAIIALL